MLTTQTVDATLGKSPSHKAGVPPSARRGRSGQIETSFDLKRTGYGGVILLTGSVKILEHHSLSSSTYPGTSLVFAKS